MVELHDAPLAAVADDLRTGRLDAAAYVEQLRARANEIEPEVSSLVTEERRWDRLREAAERLVERYPEPADRPPLFGVPIGVKDIFHVDGMPTRAGSELPPEALTGAQGTAVTRLEDAGALVLGKTVTTEFAYFEPGPTRNPHDLEHTPGGSSSGSAAAVAAGLTPFAFGSQTVGSVIRPAAFCGVVGVKPSYGRVPTDGVIPLSESVDHVGYFTQDTEGAALAGALLCDDWRPLPEAAERPTIGVPEGPYLEQATDRAREAFEGHVGRLAAAGYEIRRIDAFEHVEAVNERHDRLVAADAALAHHEWFERYGDRYAPETRALIEEGMDVPVSAVAAARRGRETLREHLHDAMGDHGVDVWIAPAAPGPAPAGIDDTGDPVMNLPWTHAGLPTVALPAGETGDGLPLGVQCAARFGADEDLLRWSHGLADAL
jgi:Asp-tRNA(Asn)/Glu-tRNA(Gln) amidotransferase A subunit family amidase